MHYFPCEFFTDFSWNVKPRLSYRVQKGILFSWFSFYLWKFLPKSELLELLLLQLFELPGGGGPACLDVYFRTFFNCKSCTFRGSSDFLSLYFGLGLGFWLVFFLGAFCSEASFLSRRQFERKQQKKNVKFILDLQLSLVQYTKNRLW